MLPTDIVQVIGALLAGIAGVVFTYQRYIALRTKEITAAASEAANTSQFQALRDAIEANRTEAADARKEAADARKEASDARKEAATARGETAELRHEFARMDRIIHAQQRTITRMELLIRQFSKLVQKNGIPVPIYMQEELEDLIIDNETLAKRIQEALAPIDPMNIPIPEMYEFGAHLEPNQETKEIK